MNRRALGVALGAGAAVAAGFLAGFVWGSGTRDALPSATSTSYAGGVLTVRVDAKRAIGQGLAAIF